jgi:uncharacterized damage-inducible protein DinB
MSLAAALIPELEHEANATRRLLERVPADRLDYQPHPKSMTLGQLALHIAAIPGSISRLASLDGIDTLAVDFTPASPASAAELATTLEQSLADAKVYLESLDEDGCSGTFTARAGERVVFALPRIVLLRNLMMNHLYHHRGQLTVYLRLLDVPVPAVYGRSADENPLA